jgi:ABC-type proline/glycine betaine transport system permease subunit
MTAGAPSSSNDGLGTPPAVDPLGESASEASLTKPEDFWPIRGSALILSIVACASAVIGIKVIVCSLSNDQLFALVQAHAPAIVGIPAAALFSLAIVSAARSIGGIAKINIAGMHAEGATATLVLWIAAFLTFVLAIRALW